MGCLPAELVSVSLNPHQCVHCVVCLQTFVKAHHKVGVLRVKEGQRNEEDIFCNCHESGHFDEFLNVLGKYSMVNIII